MNFVMLNHLLNENFRCFIGIVSLYLPMFYYYLYLFHFITSQLNVLTTNFLIKFYAGSANISVKNPLNSAGMNQIEMKRSNRPNSKRPFKVKTYNMLFTISFKKIRILLIRFIHCENNCLIVNCLSQTMSLIWLFLTNLFLQ